MTLLRSPANHYVFDTLPGYRDHLKEVAVRNWELRREGGLLTAAEGRRRRKAYVEARERVQRGHDFVEIFEAASAALTAAVDAPYLERYTKVGHPPAELSIDGTKKPQWCKALNCAPLVLNGLPYMEGNGWKVRANIVIHTPRIVAYVEALTLLGLHVIEFTFLRQEGRDYFFTTTVALRPIDFPQLHMRMALEGKIEV
jgi:hypothetical protein